MERQHGAGSTNASQLQRTDWDAVYLISWKHCVKLLFPQSCQ